KTKSARAGLCFPVGCVYRHLKRGNHSGRITSCAAVYLAAVLEYLAAEILELAGNAAQQNGETRILPQHIHLAMRNDDSLKALLFAMITAEAKLLPNVLPILL
ncbi:Late histone H2A.L3, partial [Tyto alba]